jgi:general secretion pathway protein E
MTQAKEVIATPQMLLSKLLFASYEQAKGDVPKFWKMLAQEWAMSDQECAQQVGDIVDFPVLELDALNAYKPDFTSVGFTDCLQRWALVLRTPDIQDENAHTLCRTVVLADPLNTDLQTWIRHRLQAPAPVQPVHQDTGIHQVTGAIQSNLPIRWCVVHPQHLQAYLATQEARLQSVDSALAEVGHADLGQDGTEEVRVLGDLTMSSIAQDSSPIVRLVNSTILDAMKAQASDIHLESIAAGLQIKYRIDGVLSPAGQMPGRDAAAQVVSRIKVMAELDISEQRVPQDGRFKLSIQGRAVDFRVSVMPSLFGEDIVIRILDKRALTAQMQGLNLELLGYEGEMLRNVRNLARESYGMLLVTGPTGSGKTTTLYAALTEINHGDMKIVTIEDPIEYELAGVLQIPVNEKKGLTFAKGLRSILRHDPDKILVGEIRDAETAQIAIQSALTGHLVFTSVHANNVFDVLGRFLHLGVDTYSFVSALNGVLAQRLVRLICEGCKESYVVEPHANPESFGNANARVIAPGKNLRLLYRGVGCSACRGTGYKGRRAISELLVLDDELRELIIARAPIRALKELAKAKGTVFLRDAAIAAAFEGWTTLDEVDRVAFAH